MEICSLCKCQSVDNNRCLNCGQILGIVPVRLVQGGNALITIDMTVTDRYLVLGYLIIQCQREMLLPPLQAV